MIEDVAVENEFADVAAITRPDDHFISLLNHESIFPDALEATIFRIKCLTITIHSVRGADIPVVCIDNFDDLERIDVNMERMAREF